MCSIDFGMPTLIELPEIKDCAALCAGLGLRFVEINMNMPQYQIDRLDVDALKSASREGIYFTFHLDENFNVADFNDKVSRAYLDTALATIDLAKELGSPVLNMHMAEGIHFKLPDQKVYLFQQYNHFYMESLRKFRESCDARMAGSGVKICIENCGGFLPFMRAGVELLLRSDHFRLTYDIGHSHCARGVDMPFLLENESKIAHMHVHDAQGDKCHLVLGTGQVHLPDALRLARRQNSRCVIETKSVSGLRESVAFLQPM